MKSWNGIYGQYFFLVFRFPCFHFLFLPFLRHQFSAAYSHIYDFSPEKKLFFFALDLHLCANGKAKKKMKTQRISHRTNIFQFIFMNNVCFYELCPWKINEAPKIETIWEKTTTLAKANSQCHDVRRKKDFFFNRK